MLAASRLAIKGARRAVVVAGERQAGISVVRQAVPARGLQSVAQTDRVSLNFRFIYSTLELSLFRHTGHYHSSSLFYWD